MDECSLSLAFGRRGISGNGPRYQPQAEHLVVDRHPTKPTEALAAACCGQSIISNRVGWHTRLRSVARRIRFSLVLKRQLRGIRLWWPRGFRRILPELY
jgi:hypothetical protein